MKENQINIVLFILSIVGPSLIFWIPFLMNYKKDGLGYFHKHFYLFVASLFLSAGCLVIVCLLDKMPSGLNQDEASAGYDAYSIMTYGIDRNGMHYPVHLIAWGSGQNAAYSYFAIPFLKLFGNTVIALRLPMALVGCLSLFLLFYTLKGFTTERFAALSTAFLAINPWHIMKSRWALESNLFPEMVFLGVMLLLLAIRYCNYVLYYFSAFFLSLSSYSYGSSYYFLFFFVIIFLLYLMLHKTFPWYHILGYLLTVGFFCIPIILFLYINLFHKETIHLLWFDIPRLYVDRFHTVTSLFSKDFFKSGFKNWVASFNIFFSQRDGLPWNYTDYFGTLYYLTLPFSVAGFLHGLFKTRENRLTRGLLKSCNLQNSYYFLLVDWFIVSIFMMFILSPNINRINIVFFPLILFAPLGLKDILSLLKKNWSKSLWKATISLYYVASFVGFSVYDSTEWNSKHIEPNFYASFPEALAYSESLSPSMTYISPRANYTLVLYLTKYDTNKYIQTVHKSNPGAEFESIASFEGFSFSLPRRLEPGNCYIVFNEDQSYSVEEMKNYPVKRFTYYSVIDTTNHGTNEQN